MRAEVLRFYLSSTPGTPSSTLFPYTTLFRSAELVGGAAQSHAASLAARGQRQPGQRIQDRKSTRLNSSHANISYAVFCLKKKHSNTKSLLNPPLEILASLVVCPLRTAALPIL